MTRILIKFCGINTPEALALAINREVDFVGFVHFEKSPRHLDIKTIRAFTKYLQSLPPLGGGVKVNSVVVTVDPDDALLTELAAFKPDLIQLHGSETPERVLEIRQKFNLKVMKAISVAGPADVESARAYDKVSNLLLFDAKSDEGSTLPGGNAMPFDWKLLKNVHFEKPWLLAGGLSARNVAQALESSGAPGVDVSSGIESAPGVKDAEKMKAFAKAVRNN